MTGPYNQFTGEESYPPQITVGVDISASPYCVAVWTGNKVEYAVTNMKPYDQEVLFKAKVCHMRLLIGRIETESLTQSSKTLPFQMLLAEAPPPSTNSEQILASYLVELKEAAQRAFKASVRGLVLTHPASFNRLQLTRITAVCRKMGLQFLQLIPQPTAVAMLYAQKQLLASFEASPCIPFATIGPRCHTNCDNITTALLFNMDAIYTDVAVTSATSEGKWQIKAIVGSAIGGEQVVANSMRLFIPDFENKFKKEGRNKKFRSIDLLRAVTLEAIRQFKDKNEARFDLNMENGHKIRNVVKREQFAQVNNEVFQMCERLIRRCLQDSKIKTESLDDIIVIGEFGGILKLLNMFSSTRVPINSQAIEVDINPLNVDINPIKAIDVAINSLQSALCGAALAGAVRTDDKMKLIHSPSTSHSLGIRANGSFLCFIPRNTLLPASKVMQLTTIHDDQMEGMLIVYEGEEKTVEQNQLLGICRLKDLPEMPKGVPIIEVEMAIDSGNQLRVAVASFPFIEMPKPMINHTKLLHYLGENRIDGDKKDLATFVKKK
ncbi:heat shock 70 kDa protein 8-like [Vicia villosa]|uniref:heat shock 70 kDa protein 8-like n=1 Tax=Vicia villosa TaxID=3911 RepID=UPI00273CDD0B|nr:heat shock 70 kDa protein 8-like [Vicia villosa]XP_058772949.1 heat shock 70 kDa protein 8-like [Vicia villosa]XP_058778291.1 heat shock 70 kDa protein 8-like [Vicia villosa]